MMAVSENDFIDVWQSSKSVQEVSERLGIKKPSAYGRASNYRKRGITMKYMGVVVSKLSKAKAEIESLTTEHCVLKGLLFEALGMNYLGQPMPQEMVDQINSYKNADSDSQKP